MKQGSLGLNLSTKKTRKRELLEQTNTVVLSDALVGVVEPYWPTPKTGRPPIDIETMLRIHYLQQWFGLSDPAMEEALHDMPVYSDFAKHDGVRDRLPDVNTVLRFRHLPDKHDLASHMLLIVYDLLVYMGLLLKSGMAVEATLISVLISTKYVAGKRDPQMHQTKKGNQWCFGMKAHIGVDADSGLVHGVEGAVVNVNDVNQAHKMLHGEETDASAGTGYQRAHKRRDAKDDVQWHVAICPALHKLRHNSTPLDALTDQVECIKASIRTKVEYPFGVIKRQFGYVKVRYRSLAKNTAQWHTLFALGNLLMVRRRLRMSLA